ncbi:MAG: hypothetical protein IPO40_00375 [Fibrobacteres bacterium]|nr:hypothetical protein [Fibrobacterota bacterium]
MAEESLSGNRPESNLQVWGQLLQSLRQIGFAQAGPEYLKLARLVFESRKHQLLTSKSLGNPEDWSRLSSVAAEVRELLRPLVRRFGNSRGSSFPNRSAATRPRDHLANSYGFCRRTTGKASPRHQVWRHPEGCDASFRQGAESVEARRQNPEQGEVDVIHR